MAGRHTLTGNIQTHAAFRSRILKNEREILVYLPPGYRRATQRRYPVLYLHDGQNVFDAATAFGGVEWRVDETAQELVKKRLIQPLIIVAVANMGDDRIHEYTPTGGELGANGSARTRSRGLLRKYGRFLVEELKPFIDASYRTRPEKEFTGVGGSSLGGLASLILGLWFPNTFTRIAALSPSVWWDNSVIYRIVDELEEPLRSTRIWLDTGRREEGWDKVRELRDHLIWSGWRLWGDLEYREVPDGEHSEAAWAQRFEAVLRFLYPPLPVISKLRSGKPTIGEGGYPGHQRHVQKPTVQRAA
jgi:predicted alpha/beta superfamily hydrolase